mmetsp:Transcript_46419/g.112523  ORF Transcript_46419/g.112523 Transcript_46419/m.112523 type:complete len:387 (-) Transcript_46419:41-1201(-)
MLVETFLQGKNQDCLEQVLSFLTCNELANVGTASKTLHQIIFQANEEEGNINLMWQGAEHALTNPYSDTREFFSEKTRRIGSNAREHCRLFAKASKAAKAFEMSDEIAEDRVMVDGVFSNLVNVREYDAASVAEQKAIGAKETRTIEEGISAFKFTRVEADEDFMKAGREQKLRREERIEKLSQLKPADKPGHHEVFVRIARVASGEVISQGFCGTGQKFPWYMGLDMARDFMSYGPWQGLQILLDFQSLVQSEEIKSWAESECTADMTTGFNMTAVVIDKRDHSVQCLFQHDQTEGIRCVGEDQGLGIFEGVSSFQFPLDSKWDDDLIQLGPSMCFDRYSLSYSLSINVAHIESGGWFLMPSLNVDIVSDRSIFINHLWNGTFES